MNNEIRSLYRRFFYNDAREPTAPEGDLLTKIIPLVSVLLLAADSIRRYLEIIAPSEIFKYSQHFLLVVSIVSLIYIATRVQLITPATTESTSPIFEFVYPRKWRNFAKFLVVPILALYAWGRWQAPEPAIRFATQSPLTVDVSSYQANDIAYDLIVQNTGTTQQILTEIGVHSEVNTGWGGCMAGSTGPMTIAANYTIRFHVADPETKYKMDPPLAIQPNDAVRFTVSLVPDDSGSCGVNWESQVTVFVTNVDGVSIETKSRTITRRDINRLMAHEYSFEEIMDIAANSTDEYSRAQALRQLDAYRTSQNEEQIVRLLMASLESTTPAVRSASISALAKLGNPSAIDIIGSVLLDDPDANVRVDAAIELEKLGGSKAINYLLDGLARETDRRTFIWIAHSLIELRAVDAVRPLGDWMKSDLEDIGFGSRFDYVIDYILGGDPDYAAHFLPTFLEILEKDKSIDKRSQIAIILGQYEFGNRSDVIQALGTSAMTDSEAYVQFAAIRSLGKIASPQAVEVLKTIVSSQQNPMIKGAAEDELRKLGK